MKNTLKGMLIAAAFAVGLTPLLNTSAIARDITIDLSGEPATMDPHKQWNPTSYYVYRNIFDNLLTRDNDGEIVGQIATSWKQTSESTLELTIREGVSFHDGVDLKPSDVVFSVKRITNKDFGSQQLGQFNKIVDASAKGNVVTLTTAGPYPALMAQLVKLSIVPEHVVKAVGDDAFNAAPIGSGAYAFSEWDRGVSVTLARNENYWGAKGPFDKAIFLSLIHI